MVHAFRDCILKNKFFFDCHFIMSKSLLLILQCICVVLKFKEPILEKTLRSEIKNVSNSSNLVHNLSFGFI